MDVFEWMKNAGIQACFGPGGISLSDLKLAYEFEQESGEDCTKHWCAIAALSDRARERANRLSDIRLTDEDMDFLQDVASGITPWVLSREQVEEFELLKYEAKVRCEYEFRRNEANLFLANKSNRNRIFKKLGRVCVYCQATEQLSIDHIIPVLAGGRDDDDNLQILCLSCNSKKGSKV